MTRGAKKPAPKKKHGGARHGAGRKRDRVPPAVVARLGEIPKNDPVKLDQWVRSTLAELVVLQMNGEVSVELAASIRATCGEIRRSMPDAPKPADDDDGDDQVDGPELEDATDVKEDAPDGSLRVE